MKIEKNSNGSGYVITNENGRFELSWGDFWEICRVGREIDTKGEVKEYLSDCDDISGHDLDRIRAFPELVDKIVDKVIDVRIGEEKGDQIYDAAVECIGAHIAGIEDKVKWFRLSKDKCISIWYAPDKYDGDQFQMHLEQVGEDGLMGARCEVLSDESYATNDISFETLCETLSEICDDAGVGEEDMEGYSGNVEGLARDIFKSYEMVAPSVEQDSLVEQVVEPENHKRFLINDELCLHVWLDFGWTNKPCFKIGLESRNDYEVMPGYPEVEYITTSTALRPLCETLKAIYVDAGIENNDVDELAQAIINSLRVDSLDDRIACAKVQNGFVVPEGYPTLEKIKSDYADLMAKIKDIRTVASAKEFSKKNSVPIEVNGVSADEFVHNGGTDKDIEWIRYEHFGCLDYVYDRFDGNPWFDVWCDATECDFISDIRLSDLTSENYAKWVNADRERSAMQNGRKNQPDGRF